MPAQGVTHLVVAGESHFDTETDRRFWEQRGAGVLRDAGDWYESGRHWRGAGFIHRGLGDLGVLQRPGGAFFAGGAVDTAGHLTVHVPAFDIGQVLADIAMTVHAAFDHVQMQQRFVFETLRDAVLAPATRGNHVATGTVAVDGDLGAIWHAHQVLVFGETLDHPSEGQGRAALDIGSVHARGGGLLIVQEPFTDFRLHDFALDFHTGLHKYSIVVDVSKKLCARTQSKVAGEGDALASDRFVRASGRCGDSLR